MSETKQKPDILEQIKTRQDYNWEILKILAGLVEKLPDFRFWQILYLLGYETLPDRFYDESYRTLEEMSQIGSKFLNQDNNKTND